MFYKEKIALNLCVTRQGYIQCALLRNTEYKQRFFMFTETPQGTFRLVCFSYLLYWHKLTSPL